MKIVVINDPFFSYSKLAKKIWHPYWSFNLEIDLFLVDIA